MRLSPFAYFPKQENCSTLANDFIEKLIFCVFKIVFLLNFSCMYILQKDLDKDTTDIIPYGFDVDIIKDCTTLRNDIADVFNVIERQGPRYVQTIEKVCFSSS